MIRLYLINKFRRFILRFYVFCSANSLFRLLLNLVIGLTLSYLFYNLPIYFLNSKKSKLEHLSISNKRTLDYQYLSWLIIILLTIGYLQSKYQRALFWLINLHFLIYALPNLISFIVLIKFFELFLLTLIQNLSNLLSILSCSMNIIWKNVLERANSRLRPIEAFMNSIRNIKDETDNELNNLTRNQTIFANFYRVQNEQSIQQLIDILTKSEYEFNTDFKDLINYLTSSIYRLKGDNSDDLNSLEKGEKQESIFNCLNILIETMNSCKLKCDDLKDQCEQRMSIASWFICKPISPEKVCEDIIKKVRDNECLKIDQRSLNQTKIAKFMHDLELTKNFMKFGDLKIVHSSKLNFNKSIDETERFSQASTLLTEKVRDFLEELQDYWKYLVILFLAICIYKSNRYLIKYLRNVSFDNKLITNYFVHLDSKRKQKTKRTILPLNPLTSSLACELFELRRLPFENENSNLSYLSIIFIAVLNLLAFFINHIFIVILEEINRYFKVDFDYKSNFDLNVTVTGTGFIAKKIRNILKNVKHVSTGVHHFKSTTKDCIRDVEYLNSSQLNTCFLLLFLYVLIKMYYHLICRFRSRIVSIFYPEMEKKRSIYLYNGMLNETLRMFKNSVLNLYSKLNGENEKQDFSLNDLFVEFRGFLLRYFSERTVSRIPFINRFYCKICEQKEKKSDDQTKIEFCNQCYLTYCTRCFKFLNYKCLNCDLPYLGSNSNLYEDNRTRFL